MRFRRVFAAAAATVLVAGLGIAGATSAAAASADPADITFDCLSNTNGTADQTFTGAVGDTFTVSSSGGFCWVAATSGNYAASSFDGYGGIVTVAGTTPNSGADIFNESGPATFTIVGNGSFTIGHGTGIAYTSTITVVVSGAAATSVTPIPAWVQAYGRASADATCLEGWDPSWDLWPNDGKGGFVCQRSIPSLG